MLLTKRARARSLIPSLSEARFPSLSQPGSLSLSLSLALSLSLSLTRRVTEAESRGGEEHVRE
jgi:hypothetical protein